MQPASPHALPFAEPQNVPAANPLGQLATMAAFERSSRRRKAFQEMRSDQNQLRSPNTEQRPDREISEINRRPHDWSPVERTSKSTLLDLCPEVGSYRT
jgi:hypothetical protein